MVIDRYKLVSRHNPVLTCLDPKSPLTVGNGEFAFTADFTGLQTFYDAYIDEVPLCTQSQWGWHTIPAEGPKKAFTRDDIRLKQYDTYGRNVGYATSKEGQELQFNWLRMNPHKFNLGQIGLDMYTADGAKASADDMGNIRQTLDLWRGTLNSEFYFEGSKVSVITCCHPSKDVLAFSIESELIKKGRLQVRFAFPYGSPDKTGADWTNDERHHTDIMELTGKSAALLRILDDDYYFVSILFSSGMSFIRKGKHQFILEPDKGSDKFEFTCFFSKYPIREEIPDFEGTRKECERYWEGFWTKGGAIDLSESEDPRAFELERRIILSQYLTAIQCSGTVPPQETGLTCNSWYGKFHLEMHWWHAAHFPLWGRPELLERSLYWYKVILNRARELAASQGYRGARWPKMVAYDGIDSPSGIAPLLIWQQPHPIYLAELCYRCNPSPEFLETYRDIVFETAEFMASYAVYDSENDRFVLGPPVIPAQENHKPETTINPTFELEYWYFGLNMANEWRKRLGMDENPEWKKIAEKMSSLPVRDGVYLAHENCPDTYTKYNYDHPSMLGALGILPGKKVDRAIMENTLKKVFEQWNFERMWGWDFPMMAMTAARLGKPEIAVDALLSDSPKNVYVLNGNNRQVTRKDLPLYLPGNGGLLTAVAMMAAGWDGCELGETPGFPKNGKWKVKWEGLYPMP